MGREKIRDSNIELLRIFTMLGVIILHYNNADAGGGFRLVEAGWKVCALRQWICSF